MVTLFEQCKAAKVRKIHLISLLAKMDRSSCIDLAQTNHNVYFIFQGMVHLTMHLPPVDPALLVPPVPWLSLQVNFSTPQLPSHRQWTDQTNSITRNITPIQSAGSWHHLRELI